MGYYLNLHGTKKRMDVPVVSRFIVRTSYRATIEQLDSKFIRTTQIT